MYGTSLLQCGEYQMTEYERCQLAGRERCIDSGSKIPDKRFTKEVSLPQWPNETCRMPGTWTLEIVILLVPEHVNVRSKYSPIKSPYSVRKLLIF